MTLTYLSIYRKTNIHEYLLNFFFQKRQSSFNFLLIHLTFWWVPSLMSSNVLTSVRRFSSGSLNLSLICRLDSLPLPAVIPQCADLGLLLSHWDFWITLYTLVVLITRGVFTIVMPPNRAFLILIFFSWTSYCRCTHPVCGHILTFHRHFRL